MCRFTCAFICVCVHLCKCVCPFICKCVKPITALLPHHVTGLWARLFACLAFYLSCLHTGFKLWAHRLYADHPTLTRSRFNDSCVFLISSRSTRPKSVRSDGINPLRSESASIHCNHIKLTLTSLSCRHKIITVFALVSWPELMCVIMSGQSNNITITDVNH